MFDPDTVLRTLQIHLFAPRAPDNPSTTQDGVGTPRQAWLDSRWGCLGDQPTMSLGNDLTQHYIATNVTGAFFLALWMYNLCFFFFFVPSGRSDSSFGDWSRVPLLSPVRGSTHRQNNFTAFFPDFYGTDFCPVIALFLDGWTIFPAWFRQFSEGILRSLTKWLQKKTKINTYINHKGCTYKNGR